MNPSIQMIDAKIALLEAFAAHGYFPRLPVFSQASMGKTS
jgi:hypothetical protein